MRGAACPPGSAGFVSELGGPSFKEAAVTGANVGKAPGPGWAGPPVGAPGPWGRRLPAIPAELRFLMNGTVDEGLPAGHIVEADEVLADQVVIIPLNQRLGPGVVWADTIGGYRRNTTSPGDTWNIESWYRKDL